MTYTLVWTSPFERNFRKFSRAHPELKTRLARVINDLEQDPRTPRLQLHALGGRFQGIHAVSVTYEYRITLTLRITEREVILLDIGGHDEVYR